MTLLDRIDDVLRPRAPAERLAALRILVGAFSAIYVMVRAPSPPQSKPSEGPCQ